MNDILTLLSADSSVSVSSIITSVVTGMVTITITTIIIIMTIVFIKYRRRRSRFHLEMELQSPSLLDYMEEGHSIPGNIIIGIGGLLVIWELCLILNTMILC